MENFGLTSLRPLKPVADFGHDGRMRGCHAQDVLDSATVDDSLLEALDGVDLSIGTTAQRALSSANLLRRPMTPRELSMVLAQQAGTVGIILGREGTGLNNQLSLCDAIVTIPSSEAYKTLNLSHAAAIIFYELFTSKSKDDEEGLATDEIRDTILRFLSDSMTIAGVEDYKIGLTNRAVKNFLAGRQSEDARQTF